jgi:hypothetical protein
MSLCIISYQKKLAGIHPKTVCMHLCSKNRYNPPKKIETDLQKGKYTDIMYGPGLATDRGPAKLSINMRQRIISFLWK